MERSEFRLRMDQFKQTRESNPLLSYWEWKNSLPDNLAHTPDWQYNNFGAYTGGLKPELNEDGYYHLGSRNPYTGEILKPKSHPTYDKAILNDAAAGYFPYEKNGITYTRTYSPTGDISGYANGTDGIQSNTSEIPVTYSNGKWNYGYNPGAGFLKPVISIQDAANLTPVGNAIMANDVYQSASQGDYITAGLIGAAALLPGAISKPLKKIVREIPSVNPKYFSDKINKVLGREVKPNGLSRDVYTDAINQRNRVIEDLYTDQDYWDRARAISEQYGDDYTKVYKGVLDTYENKYAGLPEPKAKQFFGDAKAEMAARKDAMERFRMNKIPAGYTDFEYNISPHLDRIDRPTALHELGHYVDFNLSQNANADYNNNMFSALRRDLSTDNNPLYPDKTDYFRQGTELKSYMNTLRSYMLSIGLMDRPGLKVTTKTIKRAINSLPSEMNAVRAAYLLFSSPGKYTKWFNKIPLLSIPGAAMYLDSKEDNSYSNGTDGIKYYGAYSPKLQAYVLPVYDDKGENNIVLPEVTVTPLSNTDLAGYMQKGDFIKEAMSFTPVGDVEDIYNIGKDIYDKNYALAALGAGLFLLPNIVNKPIKKLIKFGRNTLAGTIIDLSTRKSISNSNKKILMNKNMLNETDYFRPYRNRARISTVGDIVNISIPGISKTTNVDELSMDQIYKLANNDIKLRNRSSFSIFDSDDSRLVHMDATGPQPINEEGFIPKLEGYTKVRIDKGEIPEIWWSKHAAYYPSELSYIGRTIVTTKDKLKKAGVKINQDGNRIVTTQGTIPFNAIEFGLEPNIFGWYDRVKYTK